MRLGVHPTQQSIGYDKIKDTDMITKTITDIVNSFEGDWKVDIKYKADCFIFYISPKE